MKHLKLIIISAVLMVALYSSISNAENMKTTIKFQVASLTEINFFPQTILKSSEVFTPDEYRHLASSFPNEIANKSTNQFFDIATRFNDKLQQVISFFKPVSANKTSVMVYINDDVTSSQVINLTSKSPENCK